MASMATSVNARARLLLHPVRMRIVIALGADDLTTREIQQRMPDVPQASLYRAIAQLAKAGVVEVVKEQRRGGAMERTYHIAPEQGLVKPDDLTSSTPSEFLAIVQTFADLMVGTASRYLAATGEGWRDARYAMRHESMWLTPDERQQLSDDLDRVLDSYVNRERRDASSLYSLQISVMPEVSPHEDAPDEDASDEDASDEDAPRETDGAGTTEQG